MILDVVLASLRVIGGSKSCLGFEEVSVDVLDMTLLSGPYAFIHVTTLTPKFLESLAPQATPNEAEKASDATCVYFLLPFPLLSHHQWPNIFQTVHVHIFQDDLGFIWDRGFFLSIFRSRCGIQWQLLHSLKQPLIC